MMKRIAGACALLMAAQCAASAAPAVEFVKVRVMHVAQGHWRVHYQLDQPADQLRFIDDFGLRRHDRWKVETPGFRLVARNGNEYIERSNGNPFRNVTVRFDSDVTKLDKKYPLNKTFTDGSEWLCTLHLYAAPWRGGVQGRSVVFPMKLMPTSGESIVLDGHRERGPVNWTDPRIDRGTFIYFGKLAPIETDNVIAIVDPGLPGYLEGQFNVLLPKLFAYYRERTGYALRKRPVILITYHPQEDSGQGDSGEVLPDVIAFDLRSRTFWETKSPANTRMSFHLLAHEAAHLWNGNQFESVEGNAAPWMHEGGADAFDWAAARDFGVIDERRLREEIELNLNRCALNLALRETSLEEAFKQQYYEFAYVCGSVMNMAVDAAMRERGGQFAFWHALFAEAETSLGQYSVDQYLRILEKVAGDPALATFLRTLWSTALPDPARSFATALAEAGVRFSSGPAPPEFSRRYTRSLFQQLLAVDCPGGSGITEDANLVVVHGRPECRTFKNPDDAVVSAAGQRISDGGSAVYAAAVEHCSERKKVEFGLLDGGTIAVDCATPLRTLPRYLIIEDWPAPARGK